jgi:hypothetical protein
MVYKSLEKAIIYSCKIIEFKVIINFIFQFSPTNKKQAQAILNIKKLLTFEKRLSSGEQDRNADLRV